MTSNIDWTNELLNLAENKNLQALLDWAGEIVEHKEDSDTHSTFVLRPYNNRISKIILNLDNSKLEKIYVHGDTFFLPFDYILGLINDYKTTFNTYDAIDDEQFIFYSPNITRPLIGVDSWIEKEQQLKPHKEISFRNVSFYFDETKIPIHYRDGWYFTNPLKI